MHIIIKLLAKNYGNLKRFDFSTNIDVYYYFKACLENSDLKNWGRKEHKNKQSTHVNMFPPTLMLAILYPPIIYSMDPSTSIEAEALFTTPGGVRPGRLVMCRLALDKLHEGPEKKYNKNE